MAVIGGQEDWQSTRRWLRGAWAVGLLTLCGVLAWAGPLGADVVPGDSPSLHIDDWGELTRHLAGRILSALAGSLGIAFCTAIVWGPSRADRSATFLVFAFVALWVFGTLLTIGVRGMALGRPLAAPSFLSLGWLAFGGLIGTWLGVTWLRARNVFRWGVTQVLLGLSVLPLTAIGLAWMGLSPRPLAILAEPVGTEDRRRLVEWIKAHDPRRLGPRETAKLTLTERDANQLASWGLSLIPGEQRARVSLRTDELALRLSLELPVGLGSRRFLNLAVMGRPVVKEGTLGFRPSFVSLGRLRVPAPWLAVSGPVKVDAPWRNALTEPFLQSVQDVAVERGAASVRLTRIEIDRSLARKALRGFGVANDLQSEVVAHVEHLIRLADAEPELSFSQCMEAAFEKAASQSGPGTSIHENRAAILALGYTVGHPRVRLFLGENVPPIPAEASRRFARVTLHGRRDWARHYVLSATLQVLGNTLTSLDLGLLKEELDADGGSGFSFGDLLADRAGTKLAERATETEEAAAKLARRIAEGFEVDAFVPRADDLPEGLSDERLQSEFGGVGGERFRELDREINRRVENCPAFRTPASNADAPSP